MYNIGNEGSIFMKEKDLNRELTETKAKLEKLEAEKNSKFNRFFEENRKVIRTFIISGLAIGIMAHAAFTLPYPTFSSGTTISSSQMNANMAAISTELNTLGNSSGQILAKMGFTTAPSITASTGTNSKKSKWTGNKHLKFDNKLINIGSCLSDISSLYTRFTAPSNGWYEFYINLEPTFNLVSTSSTAKSHNMNITITFEKGIPGTTSQVASFMNYRNRYDANGNGTIDSGDTDSATIAPGTKHTFYLKTGETFYFTSSWMINNYDMDGDSSTDNDNDEITFNPTYSEVIIKKI